VAKIAGASDLPFSKSTIQFEPTMGKLIRQQKYAAESLVLKILICENEKQECRELEVLQNREYAAVEEAGFEKDAIGQENKDDCEKEGTKTRANL
jgi:hypothetical protein